MQNDNEDQKTDHRMHFRAQRPRKTRGLLKSADVLARVADVLLSAPELERSHRHSSKS